VTGATGMLGATLVEAWRRDWQVTAVGHRFRFDRPGVESVSADLADVDALASLVDRVAPDCIVHCAALTSLDVCEKEPDLARVIHRDATASLARAARRRDATFVYISTDALFSGRERAHREDDPVDPKSVYARTKWEGEGAALQETDGRALVVRTCIVGWSAQPKVSLAEWMLAELRAGRPITGFSDVFFTPLLCNSLERALRRLMQSDVRGLLHVGGADAISKYGFGLAVAKRFGLPEGLVREGSIGDSALLAARPRYPCLDSSRYVALTGAALPGVEQDLREMKRLEEEGYPALLRESVARN